jgi:hypothetical protein
MRSIHNSPPPSGLLTNCNPLMRLLRDRPMFFRFFWSAVFSACYILGGIVVESPGCPLAPAALSELERAITFYEEGSTTRIPSTTVVCLAVSLRDQIH